MSLARGTGRRPLRLAAAGFVAVLALSACSGDDDPVATAPTSPPSSEPAEPTATPTRQPPPSLAELVVAPGRIGPAAAGMTRDEALATGLFEADVEVGGQECGRVEPLGFTADYAASLDVLTSDDGTVISLGVRGDQPRTADGLGVGSTLREVSAAYETAEMVEAGYGQTGVFVTEGDLWLGFLFDADPESIGPKEPVMLLEVTRGVKPDLMRDGC